MNNVIDFPEVKCGFCGKEATRVCDKPKGEHKTFICSNGRRNLEIRTGLITCDKPICKKCATHIDGMDLCPDCLNTIKKALG